MAKRVLWVSLMVPYDNVSHASGKTQNWYLKELAKENDFEVRLASFYKPEEINKIDLNKYGIKSYLFKRPRGGLVNEIKRVMAWLSKIEVWNRYGGLTTLDYRLGIKKIINEIQNDGYIPEIVILQWTEMLFFLPYLKKYWPKAKYIAIEEDVSFLGLERKAAFYKNIFSKIFFRLKSIKVRKIEIDFLNESDLVIFNNDKDRLLAKKYGYVGNSITWSVYYQDFSNIKLNNSNSNTVAFYGAMGREENWKSCVWFIEEVMPLLGNMINFVIIGGNPKRELLSYEADNINIMGYVDDVGSELSKVSCFVAPLVMGAGIKVKILEAMSLALPVITNTIGIEGIPAEDTKDFYYCVTPEEYAETIKTVIRNPKVSTDVGLNAQRMIMSNFDYKKDSERFIELLKKITK